jgi:hypothetical protein
METLNHRIRAGIWRSALRFGSSVVGVLPGILIDVFLRKSTQYPAKGRFIRNPSPTCRTAQNIVIPNRHYRT